MKAQAVLEPFKALCTEIATLAKSYEAEHPGEINENTMALLESLPTILDGQLLAASHSKELGVTIEKISVAAALNSVGEATGGLAFALTRFAYSVKG